MARLSARQKGKTNSRGAVRRTISGSPLHLNAVLSGFAKARWPRKTDVELSLRTELKERQAKALAAGHAEPSGDTLARLIISDAGFGLLAALMDALPERDRPEWWQRIRHQMRLSDLRRAHEEQRRLIEQMELEAGR